MCLQARAMSARQWSRMWFTRLEPSASTGGLARTVLRHLAKADAGAIERLRAAATALYGELRATAVCEDVAANPKSARAALMAELVVVRSDIVAAWKAEKAAEDAEAAAKAAQEAADFEAAMEGELESMAVWTAGGADEELGGLEEEEDEESDGALRKQEPGGEVDPLDEIIDLGGAPEKEGDLETEAGSGEVVDGMVSGASEEVRLRFGAFLSFFAHFFGVPFSFSSFFAANTFGLGVNSASDASDAASASPTAQPPSDEPRGKPDPLDELLDTGASEADTDGLGVDSASDPSDAASASATTQQPSEEPSEESGPLDDIIDAEDGDGESPPEW